MGRSLFLTLYAALAVTTPAAAWAETANPLIIAHRGSSGERPEHTLAAYERAIDQGADYIEPDLVATRDGVLVARHENEFSGTTDVASRPEFAGRRRSHEIDGEIMTGWFAEDFTLAELRTLRVRERLPEIRPANTRYDGLFQVPTLAEIAALVKAKEAETGRSIGLYPELKHPSFLREKTGIDTIPLLVQTLGEAGLTPDDAVIIQCFEIAPLKRLRETGAWKLVQLMAPNGGPADAPAMRYADMATPAGLAEIATYADGVGAAISMVLDDAGAPTSLVADAHAAGLVVHAWTLRRENAFLPEPLRKGTQPDTPGDIGALYGQLKRAGVDGIFTDNPADAAQAQRVTDALTKVPDLDSAGVD